MGKKLLFSIFVLVLTMLSQGNLGAQWNLFRTPFFGIASWYSETDRGINRRTANGEIFNDSKLTCASWDFHFGTQLKVTHLVSGKSVLCRVNDRGPRKRLGRLIDLTRAAFSELAPLRLGLIPVKVEVVDVTE